MLARHIIPCLDIDKGRVVKGIKIEDVADRSDPLQVCRHYVDQGADELMFIDITSGVERHAILIEVLHSIAAELFIPVMVAGGIRSSQDVRQMLQAGADKVAINTAAIINPDLIAECTGRFGAEAIVVAVDAKRRGGNAKVGWELMSHAGRKSTGMDAVEWAVKMAEQGAGQLLLTSMDRDGSGKGFDIDLVQAVRQMTIHPLIAAGGAGSPEDIEAVINQGGADAVMVASIFHDGKFTIAEAKNHLMAHNVPIRH
ncbi:MAG: imidazole glycerol phosphate synthase subunit HisF [Gammaproteobacteria bacterium]